MRNDFVKTLRKNLTEPERVLWHYLRNRRFKGYKFRRQVPIGNYIADFVCYEARLIIELDGRQHLTSESLKYDGERTEYLEGQYFRVIRFYNTEILNQIECVLEKIYQELVSPSSELRSASPVKGEALGMLTQEEHFALKNNLVEMQMCSDKISTCVAPPVKGEASGMLMQEEHTNFYPSPLAGEGGRSPGEEVEST